MFLDFFLILKNQGVPVTLKEYLWLLEALKNAVIDQKVDEFYHLSKSMLVKNDVIHCVHDRYYIRISPRK